MYINRRRLLRNLAAAGAALLVAACDARTPNADVVKDDEPASSAPEANAGKLHRLALAGLMEANPAPDGSWSLDGMVDIYFHFSGLSIAGRDAVQKHVANFRDLTRINVRPEFVNWAGSFQDIARYLAAQSAPDVWCGGTWWVPALAEPRQVLEIDAYVEHWDEWSDFYPAARADVEHGGHILGVPYRSNYRGSPVIRPSVFEAAGVPARVPSTWDELNEIAPKLTIKDGELVRRVGFALEHSAQVYEDWLLQAGGSVFSDSLQIPTNHTAQGFQALTQHVRYAATAKYSYVARRLHSFCSGGVAIQQLWATDVGNCELNAPAMFDDLVAGRPFEGPKSRSMSIQFDKYMPNLLTKNPDATFETIKFFASPSVVEDIHGIGGRAMPCRMAMEYSRALRSEPYKSLAQNAKLGTRRQLIPNQLDVESAITSWVKKASAKEVSVEAALRGMDVDITGLISES